MKCSKHFSGWESFKVQWTYQICFRSGWL